MAIYLPNWFYKIQYYMIDSKLEQKGVWARITLNTECDFLWEFILYKSSTLPLCIYCLSWNKNWSQLQDNVTAEKYFKVFFGIFWFLVPNLLRPSRENPLKLDKIRNWLYKVGWFITQILNFKYKHNKWKIKPSRQYLETLWWLNDLVSLYN